MKSNKGKVRPLLISRASGEVDRPGSSNFVPGTGQKPASSSFGDVIAKFTREIESLNRQLRNLDTVLNSMNDDIYFLRNKVSTLESNLNQANNQIEEIRRNSRRQSNSKAPVFPRKPKEVQDYVRDEENWNSRRDRIIPTGPIYRIQPRIWFDADLR
jgi:exonuclease VII small subunit